MSEETGGVDVSRELLEIVDGPSGTAGELLGTLAEIRRACGQPACGRLVELLTGVSLPEPAAERALAEIATHRVELVRCLGRDPGLAVSAFDYFVNLDPRLRAPRMVEMQRYLEMERLAETDPLTELANRRRFRAAGSSELRRSGRYGLAASLLFLDLDDFKSINDFRGHGFGDIVLKEAADLLRRAIRDVDLAARYGGEEFAVLLPETPRSGALVAAERIRREFSVRFSGENADRPRLTISGGVATFPEDGSILDELLWRADEALYRAKATGKNRVLAASPDRKREARFELPQTPFDSIVFLSGDRSEKPGIVEMTAKAMNISRSGALVEPIEGASSIPVGCPVRLRLDLSDRSRPPIVVTGRVVRHAEAEGRRRLGIAFERPERRSDNVLDRLLALSCPAAAPPPPGAAAGASPAEE